METCSTALAYCWLPWATCSIAQDICPMPLVTSEDFANYSSDARETFWLVEAMPCTA